MIKRKNERKVHQVNATPRQEHVVDVGVVDFKGRRIGYLWQIWQADFVDAPEGDSNYYVVGDDELGHWYLGYCSPTRDGKTFGAYSRLPMQRTRAALEAAILKRVGEGTARYRKQFGTTSATVGPVADKAPVTP